MFSTHQHLVSIGNSDSSWQSFTWENYWCCLQCNTFLSFKIIILYYLLVKHKHNVYLIPCLQLLNDPNHLVKCSCLTLLGELIVVSSSNGDGVRFVCNYTKCQDPRVRTAAYNAMVNVLQNTNNLLFLFLFSPFSSVKTSRKRTKTCKNQISRVDK